METYTRTPLEEASYQEALERYHRDGGPVPHEFPEGFESLSERVRTLKRERDAVILAHYYVPAEVQALADYVGDSFYLARLACTLEARVIVLCGVSFMGQSVKLLNPSRIVLAPEPLADCPMAHMVRRQDVDMAHERFGDDLAVVCYVNSTAEIKAWSDVCVTSSNAIKVVRELPQGHILFIPDKNLGRYIARQVPEKHFILNDGFCPVHQGLDLGEIHLLRRDHPFAELLAHPECTEAALAEADFIGSTKQIIERIVASARTEFIVLTEAGVQAQIERLTAGQGKRVFYTKTPLLCPDMRMISAEKLLRSLEEGYGEIALPDDAERANAPLRRMLDLAVR